MPHWPDSSGDPERVEADVSIIKFYLASLSFDRHKHPLCKGKYDEWNGDYDCDYRSNLLCEDCKYGGGRKDPEAKCNQPKDSR